MQLHNCNGTGHLGLLSFLDFAPSLDLSASVMVLVPRLGQMKANIVRRSCQSYKYQNLSFREYHSVFGNDVIFLLVLCTLENENLF